MNQKTPEGTGLQRLCRHSLQLLCLPPLHCPSQLRVVLWAAGPCCPHLPTAFPVKGSRAPLIRAGPPHLQRPGSGLRRAPMREAKVGASLEQQVLHLLIPAGGLGRRRQGLGGLRINPRPTKAVEPLYVPPGPSVGKPRRPRFCTQVLGNLTWLQPSCQLVRPNLCPGCAPDLSPCHLLPHTVS